MAGKKIILFDERVDCMSPALLAAGDQKDVQLLSLGEWSKIQEPLHPENRVIATSETVLPQLIPFLDPGRKEVVATLKDKAAWRSRLQDHYPEIEFQVIEGRIPPLDPSKEYILKPAEGYAGIGSRRIRPGEELNEIWTGLQQEVQHWSQLLEGVFSVDKWLIETYVSGQLFASDAWFDEEGKVHLIGLYREPGSRAEDGVECLLSMTYPDLAAHNEAIRREIQQIGGVLGIANLPVHFEFIQTPEGKFIPIDLNPLRFCSAGGHNLVLDAFGLNPFLAYLEDHSPNPLSLWNGQKGVAYHWVLVNRSDPTTPPDSSRREKVREILGNGLRSVSWFEQPFHTLDASAILSEG